MVVGLVFPHRCGWVAAQHRSCRDPQGGSLDAGGRRKGDRRAKEGDIVQLPAGTAVWSKRGWNTGHSPKMKAITIQGAGIDQTIITVDKSQSGNTCFELEGVEGKPFRVTGITFDGSLYPRDGSWGPLMSVCGTCKNFRVDHCKFKNSDCMLSIQGDTYGLVDHCCFDGQISHGGNVQPINFSGPGGANYRKPLSLGTDQATYFEDNEVYIAPTAGANGKRSGNNPWIVPYNCARIVIRHNKIVNAELEIYGPGRNGQYGCQQCEIYDNQFSLDDNTSANHHRNCGGGGHGVQQHGHRHVLQPSPDTG